MDLVLAFLGATVGIGWGDASIRGALVGALLGYLLGAVWKQRRQLKDLRRRLLGIETRLAKAAKARDGQRAPTEPPAGTASRKAALTLPTMIHEKARDPAQTPAQVDSPAPEEAAPAIAPGQKSSPAGSAHDPSAGTPQTAPAQWGAQPDPQALSRAQSRDPVQRLTEYIGDYFRGGNLIVRIAVIVLFFGVAFLLKYAAENTRIAIEYRLSAVAVAAVGLLIFGWRLRNRRQHYGLVLQGGAVGILYLTTFSALRLYSVLPAGAAFTLMLAFVIFSAVLALAQNSRALAVLGSIGGFLAPLLVSTGQGSHVVLFGYYLLLNIGIVAIARVKSWRLLNLVGFAFTFVIGGVWGFQYYAPRYFATTEPFLISFLLLYVAVAILYAHTQSLKLKGLVDGALVFGVPVAVAGLQAALVRDQEYGLAISAVILGAFYIVLAGALYRRSGPPLRILAESFLAIGVVFATLSIPFALDGRISAAFWALEGAAAVWLGLRQAHLLPRLFGVALQFLAGALYLGSLRGDGSLTPLLNGDYLGAALIAGGALIIAFVLDRNRHARHAWESALPPILFTWAMIWWLGGNTREILLHSVTPDHWPWLLVLLSASAGLAEIARLRLPWPRLALVALGLLPALILLASAMASEQQHLLQNWATPAWLLAIAVLYVTQKRIEASHTEHSRLFDGWHLGAFWLLLLMLTLEASWRLNQWLDGAMSWKLLPWGVVPVLTGFALFTFGRRIPWPFAAHYRTYATLGILPVALALLFWAVLINTLSRGESWPLNYLPILNPTDLGIFSVILFLMRWWLESGEWLRRHQIDRIMYLGIVGALVFYWLNGITVRSVYHFAAVPFDLSGMLRSRVLQTSLTVLWALCGLGCMLAGTLKVWRRLWLIGAGLMVVVVAKLFLVDLSGTGTVERIVSFLGVGVLLLIVGWYSPAPPSEESSQP